MARISFSPLITAARGSVMDTTFSIWKGREYIRARVTPANPNTLLQQAQRARITAAVTYWQTMHADLVANWNVYASPYQMSGYNACTARNAPLMATADENIPILTPAAPKIKAIEDFAPVQGAANEIDATWTTDGWTAADTIYVAALIMDPNTYYLGITLIDTAAGNAGTITLTGLGDADIYTVIAAMHQDTTDAFSATVGAKGIASGAV